ncbi:MAG: Protein of unknown function (DUF3995) [Rhodobacteraceae bacterium HLUCCA08]|nr:MAG: Protein of unknown function (DUF3995) [Rhodobacteraceae bacterium HLUCCA08]
MMPLAFLMSAILVVIAAIHLLWALGWWFPIRDEARLARAVVGARGITRMPGPVPTALVVVALLFAAAWPWFPPGPGRKAGLVAIALVFQLRAVLAYAPPFQAATPEQPFRRLDERLYGPLCGALGIGYMMLAFAGTAAA